MEKVVTRDQAVQETKTFFMQTQSPNVLPDNSKLCLGFFGLFMYGNKDTATSQHLYFPICPDHVQRRYDIKSVRDRASIYEFVDENHSQMFCREEEKLFEDDVYNMYVLIRPRDQVGIEIPGLTATSFKSLQYITRKFHTDLFSYYSRFFEEVLALAFAGTDKENALTVARENDNKPEASQFFMANIYPKSHLYAYTTAADVVSALYFYDGHVDQNMRIFKVVENAAVSEYVFVVPDQKQGMRVPLEYVTKSLCLSIVLSESKLEWVAKSDLF